MSARPTLAIAFPVYNEAREIAAFLHAVDVACESLSARWEIEFIIVNDGSTDETPNAIRACRLRFIRRRRLIHLSRNVGHPFAVQCLIHSVDADAAIIMDADFQDDPSLIPQLVGVHEAQGPDLVRVARVGTGGQNHLNPLFYVFRKMFRAVTGEAQSFGTFGLYSRRAIQALRNFSPEAHYYFPGLVSLIGFNTAVLTSPRRNRVEGQSRMGIKRLVQLSFDALFSFSVFPIRVMAVFGVFLTIASIAGIGTIVAIRLCTALAIPGWSSILVAVTFFGGVQLSFLGILGEYIARIFQQVKQRPHYFIAATEDLP